MRGLGKDSSAILHKSILMNNGQYAECIAYRGCFDIDIRFEDGTIREHIAASQFKKGAVKNPNKPCEQKRYINSCKDERRLMSNGEYATCVVYRNARDIDIQFDDGTIVEHRCKSDFYNQKISNPNNPKASCKGETYTMLNGDKATCIEYNKAIDIKVKFHKTGSIVSCTKKSFINGIVHDPLSRETKVLNSEKEVLNKTLLMNCGLYCTCVEYFGARNLTVEFEDGTRLYNIYKDCFLARSVLHPKLPRCYSLPQYVLYTYVLSFFPDAIIDYKPDWLRCNGYKYELDIYIPSLKVGVEYDGAFFHSNEMHNKKYQVISKAEELNTVYQILEVDAKDYSTIYEDVESFQLSTTTNRGCNLGLYLQDLSSSITWLLGKLGVVDFVVNITADEYSSLRESLRQYMRIRSSEFIHVEEADEIEA